MPRRQRTMKGGFLDSIASSLTSAWESTKKASSDAYNSATGSTPTPTTYTPTPTTTSSSGYMGGKRRKSRKMSGGYSDNTPLTGLAASASPISGIESAKPHTIVGGKRKTKRRRSHKHSKSCKKCKQ